jgi:hypothetical protein
LIDATWRRVGGFHVEDDGTVGAVWLAHDPLSSVVHCYDAALFHGEVPVVMADGIAARGRHYPVAWAKKDKSFADKFLDAGINVLPEPCMDDPGMIEVSSRTLKQMLMGSRFRVDKRVGEWFREYKDFFRDGSKVPAKGFPLMAATRHALEMIDYARAESFGHAKRKNYPELAIV